MAVKKYEKNGRTYWQVYVNLRSKHDYSIRIQRRTLDLASEKDALAEEKRLLLEAAHELGKAEGKNLTWEEVIKRWELCQRSVHPTKKYELTTIIDHASRLHIWTKDWLKRPACELNRGDARDAINAMQAAGKSKGYQHQLKHTVNVVFDWGVETRLIKGVHQSPMRGVQMPKAKTEQVPDILTLDEMRKLLFEAKAMEHPWYPIWATAILTGMRCGELHALLWSDVDLDNRKIVVSKSYQSKGKFVKSTKSGQWRTVPISDELYTLFMELKQANPERAHVLPRFAKWNDGEQAEVLRMFCRGIGIRSVRFHALRACFATQLLAHDVAPARIMKICGWQDLKTMQHYTRLAGIDERGATQVLKVLPNDAAVMGEVVSLLNFKAGRKQ